MRLTLITALLLMSANANAFINIEEVRRVAGPGFVGKSSATINGQRGNTDKFATGISTLNIYRQDENEYLVLGDYNVSVTSGATDTNNGRLHLRYTLHPQRKYSNEYFAQTEFDQFKQIRTRDLFGTNLRQRLHQDENSSLYAGYGTFFEYQDWSNHQNRKTLRANLYLSYVSKLRSGFSAFAVAYFQPSWLALNDFRFELQTGTTAIITERLSLTAQLSVASDTRRPAGVKPTDVTYQSGLILKY